MTVKERAVMACILLAIALFLLYSCFPRVEVVQNLNGGLLN